KGEADGEVLRRAVRYAVERKRIESERAGALALALQSKLAAEDAIWQRDDFISVAAHELRTPLTSLMLQTQFLVDRFKKADQAASLAQMKKLLRTYDREVGRLKNLVNNLLDVTRISTGRLQVERCPCDLSELARTVIEDMEPLLREAQCSVRIQSSGPVV